ncbi:MAG TPA: response regulator transcription factor [Oscillospiraceae bacterium]|nr:response regulator transcription factor [Oscillospiraceae bacterium]HPF55166.1 response regulator transcription factor [Clostridiales bacterium]HPK34595.1 response regulator transcription factor [Oscillospiraceae bacterium]HPR75941.1 response regulator transcription factor [Oscillospiraceae bacterium]
MYQIFIVEDDPTIAKLMGRVLEKWGFSVCCVSDFSAVLTEFRTASPHLVVMDVSLPYYDGYYWCEQIRRESKVPILFVSSHTDNMDAIMAVNMGGDDYITKPFAPELLTAKINALLRRAYSYTAEPPVLEARGALLAADGTLSYDGQKIELSKNEFRILKILIEHKNQIVTRETLIKALWESEDFIDDNTLTVNVNRMRKKLSDNGLDDLITTRKGEGYLIHD